MTEDPRLDGPSQNAGDAQTALRRYAGACLECGQPFSAAVASAEFCNYQHRKAYNNRRSVRGVLIYDLFMTLRYDRGIAKALNVWTLLCRLGKTFRDEDNAKRDGRKSWRPAERVLSLHPYLYAVKTDCRRRARK